MASSQDSFKWLRSKAVKWQKVVPSLEVVSQLLYTSAIFAEKVPVFS